MTKLCIMFVNKLVCCSKNKTIKQFIIVLLKCIMFVVLKKMYNNNIFAFHIKKLITRISILLK